MRRLCDLNKILSLLYILSIVCFSSLRNSLLGKMNQRDHAFACPICWDEFKGGEDDIILGVIKSCGHYFHLNCIFTWLDNNNTCPICRGNAELSESAIRAISYFDLKRVIGPPRNNNKISIISTSSSAKSAKNKSHGRSFRNLAFMRSSETVDEDIAGNMADGTGRCGICHDRYEDNPQFMVVGYLPRCAHYYHFRCIWNHVMRHNPCPMCLESGSLPPDDTAVLEVYMALLSDVM